MLFEIKCDSTSLTSISTAKYIPLHNNIRIKGTCLIQSQFLFLIEKSILYAKIMVSEVNVFSQNSVLNAILAFNFHS